jgi:CRISPR/Cas system CMR-associated protein Cmr5 small subunit
MRGIIKNKRGQEGETLTWMPAIIAIVIILGLSIALAFIMSKTKVIKTSDVKTDFAEGSSLKQKTAFAYLLTSYKDREKADEILKQSGDGENG